MEKQHYQLIPHPRNSVSYEHCVVQHLPPDIYIGDAERNYYVNAHKEINLCVHYNYRIPGRYAFLPVYRFYLTEGRQSLALHHSLGIIDEAQVLARYNSLEDSKESPYYQDFCELKEKIDTEIQRQKKHQTDYQDSGGMGCACKEAGQKQLCLYEMYLDQTNEYVQFHTNEEGDECQISVSKCSITDLWRYLDDFYELEPAELHLLKYLSMEHDAISKTSSYHTAYKEMLRIRELLHSIYWVTPDTI